jgi:hypothetical protein
MQAYAQPEPNQSVTPIDAGLPAEVPRGMIGTQETAAGEFSDLAEAALGARLNGMFIEYRDARKEHEDRWLDDFRAFCSKYDPTTLANLEAAGGRSKIFVGLTRTKVMSGYSRIVDLLFQPGQDFWSVEPTPLPELTEEETAHLAQKAAQEVATIAQMMPSELQPLIAEREGELQEDIEKEVKKLAKKAAERMTLKIRDQLIEQQGERKIKMSLLECAMFGTGCIKTGTVKIERRRKWKRVPGPRGDRFVRDIVEEIVPEIESVSIFDMFPDPYATDHTDMHGCFRRHVLTRRQFSDLRKSPNFDKGVLSTLLDRYPRGNYLEEQHDRERRNIAGSAVTTGRPNRYEVLEYWGSINGHDLEEFGVTLPDGADPDDEFDASVWICGGEVVRAVLSASFNGPCPYLFFPYEKMPHQFWGVGIAFMMRDSQTTMNAATRIFIDNAAISSGPIIELNTDFLAAGEDATELHPWRIFLREGGDPQAPMVRFHQPQSNANSVGAIIDMFRRFADETTSLPSYTHGETAQSMNKTATGMSILMGNANVALKATIKNIDDFGIKPMVEALYHFNMEWAEDETLKGDMRVNAQGSASLIQREVRSQRMLQFLQIITNPADLQYTKRQDLLREIAKSMDIDPDTVIRSQEEIERELLLQAAAQPGLGAGGPPGQSVPGMGGVSNLSNGAAGGLPGQVGERAGSQI